MTLNRLEVKKPSSRYNHVYDLVHRRKYNNALELLEQLFQPSEKGKETWIVLKADCLRFLKRFNEALETYQSVPNWKNRTKVQLHMGRLYLQQGDMEKAIAVYEEVIRITDQGKRDSYFLQQCYLELIYTLKIANRIDDALQVAHQRLSRQPTDTKTLVCIAHLYETKAVTCQQEKENQFCFEQALQHFTRALGKGSDRKILLSFGHCYRNAKRYAEAIQTFKQISDWESDKTVVSGMALCYEALGDSSRALALLKALSCSKTDRQIKHQIDLMGNQFQQAVVEDDFHRHANEERDREVLAYSRFYQSLGSHFTALNLFQSLPNVADEEVKLSLASCYESLGLHEKSAIIFDEVKQQNRNGYAAHYYYYARLFAQNDEKEDSVSDKASPVEDNYAKDLEGSKQRRFRLVDKPAAHLDNDPVLLLHSAYYISQGFKPDKNLDRALQAWQNSGQYNKKQLFAVARKHLTHADKEKYVSALEHYGLLEKLFGLKLNAQENKVEALEALLTKSVIQGCLLTNGLFKNLPALSEDQATSLREIESTISEKLVSLSHWLGFSNASISDTLIARPDH